MNIDFSNSDITRTLGCSDPVMARINLHTLKSSRGIASWLYRIAANAITDHYRRQKPWIELADEVAVPEIERDYLGELAGCIAGASLHSEVEAMRRDCGFTNIRVSPKNESKSFLGDWAPGTDVTAYVVSAAIEAVKPLN